MRSMLLMGLASVGIACQLDDGGFGLPVATGGVHSEGSTAAATTDGTGPSPTSAGDAEGDGGSAGSTSTSNATTNGADETTASGTTTGPGGCTRDNGGCDPNATCDDTSGRVECTCNRGYEGDGLECTASADLPTLRIEIPCTLESCGVPYCVAANGDTDMQVLSGESGTDYAVTLRVRGVVEGKRYNGGNQDGLWHDGGAPNPDTWNIFRLVISEPPQTYHLNSFEGTAYCIAVDYERTVTIAQGATVTLEMIDTNNCGARNLDDSGLPIVIPDIPPAPVPFDGQFLQVDAVDISEAT